ncbi:hypothetical protein EVAR_80365_1 [Eumeta japonica]|uniref:Uncharacterized protein n=1 Tax=Eumeta variegata TaxID=151549 RepID=A0A4C1WZ07_EUMVA|nr:hypothetical protein EVAR_80365_1 [Eumeta japonica]
MAREQSLIAIPQTAHRGQRPLPTLKVAARREKHGSASARNSQTLARKRSTTTRLLMKTIDPNTFTINALNSTNKRNLQNSTHDIRGHARTYLRT